MQPRGPQKLERQEGPPGDPASTVILTFWLQDWGSG